MSATRVLSFKNVAVPRQVGELARLRVLTGPDQGLIQIVRSKGVVLGRAEDVDVLMHDLKASRRHASLELTAEGWVLTDLGSDNGILFQGEFVRRTLIHEMDQFTLGETTYEFVPIEAGTRMLQAPFKSATEVRGQQIAYLQQKQRVRQLSERATVSGPAQTEEQKKKGRVLLLVALGALGYMNLDLITEFFSPSPQKVQAKNKPVAKKLPVGALDFETIQPPEGLEGVKKAAEQHYRLGLRDYREGNYVRAKQQFSLALQVNPGHERARDYWAMCDVEIKNEMSRLRAQAAKARSIGRLSEAKGYYETMIRMLPGDDENDQLNEAKESLKDLNEEMKRGY
jgi:pSer/pThr/pTyr-binding forkhead associated (FHA) protein